jgi:DHA1 family bicyclomycin/chloramphenicol resistance-like MFS transporter
MSSDPTSRPGQPEFIILIALLISMVALTIDAMLPALPVIGADLDVARANDTQLVISMFFVGFAAGQLFFGPLSDSLGRKPTILIGLGLYGLGCLLSILSSDYTVMLLGRVLQGLGAAAPRTVTLAIVRDRHAGRDMARVMSFVMAVFIIVPALAPLLGQGVMLAAGWRAIFVCLAAMGLLAACWMHWRLPESLAPENRRPLSPARLWEAAVITVSTRAALGYTIAAGFIFGAFVAYLSTAQLVFQEVFGVGPLFPAYFAAMALAIGCASLTNARLVLRLGMRRLSFTAIVMMTSISAVFLTVCLTLDHAPPLWGFMIWGLSSFFFIGLLFGNLNALAMEPLGHVAGMAAAFIGSASTVISLILGVPLGQAFDGTVLPLVAGFAVMGALCGGVMLITNKGWKGAD